MLTELNRENLPSPQAASATVPPLAAFAEALVAPRGRTALVWVTTGRAPALAQKQIVDASNTANLSVYIVDPATRTDMTSGLFDAKATRHPHSFSTSGFVTRMLTVRSRQDNARISFFDRAERLADAAEQTGGLAFVNWFNIGKVLGEIEADTSHYYLLSYAPSTPSGDGEYHEIRVEVERPSVNVRARAGYVAYPESERKLRVTHMLRELPRSAARLPVSVESYATWDERGEPVVMVATSLRAREAGLRVDAGETPEINLRVVQEFLDADGDTVAEIDELLAEPVDVDPATAPGASFITHLTSLYLKPGAYDLRVALVDQNSGRTGVAHHVVRVPNRPQSGWLAGDLILLQGGASGPSHLVVQNTVAPGSQIDAQVSVTAGERPIVTGRVLKLADREDDPNEADVVWTSVNPATVLEADGIIHRGTLTLPSTLPPGDYIVVVDVADGTGGSSQTIRSRFTILNPIPRH